MTHIGVARIHPTKMDHSSFSDPFSLYTHSHTVTHLQRLVHGVALLVHGRRGRAHAVALPVRHLLQTPVRLLLRHTHTDRETSVCKRQRGCDVSGAAW